MPKVNPDILVWARETAGLSIEEAASRLGLKSAYGKTPSERLVDLETGATEPSRSMLVRMSGKYRRPLVAFYLLEPPEKGDRGQDFRTLPSDQPRAVEGLLDALLRDVLARQSLVRSAIIDEDEVQPLPFINSRSVEDAVDAVLDTVQNTLDITLDEFRSASGASVGFAALRESAERAGVFVLLLGNLGSYHTNLEVETFRGFAVADDVAPFIVINDQDSRGAWSFTLLHELTHLILGQTGVSGGRVDRRIEKFCNDVAAAFLLPSDELSALERVRAIPLAEAVDTIDTFASARNISRSMVAYQLYRKGHIAEGRWTELSQHFRGRWADYKEAQRTQAGEQEGGPDYYIVRRHRLGAALVQTTARFVQSGALTTTKAGTILGVKPKKVQRLLDQYL